MMPNTKSAMTIVGKEEPSIPFEEEEKEPLRWKEVPWSKLEKKVYRLQKRIYTASRNGDIVKVRRLQNTLMRSWSNKMLSVRRVTQDNRGKVTAGVDGVKSLTAKQRFELVEQLKLTGKSQPTRRVWIPKANKNEKRPLGIPTMYDRALQALVKSAIEPEWEARFEPNSYGFRPGRSTHDAISQIKKSIQHASKYVLDADIAKCFDCIDHSALLQKAGYHGTIRKQIKAWLKAGVIDRGAFATTFKGTPQGGVISPLLANIALHGLEETLKQYARNSTGWKTPNGNQLGTIHRGKSLTIVRYADDFVVLHQNKAVIEECREIISEWLKGIGLELKPEKTRLAHTLLKEESEDGKAGFDFLGFHIQQHKAGKHKSSRNLRKKLTDFITLITPTKESIKKHQTSIKKVVREHITAPQESLIRKLNPIIRGWSNYYKNSDIKTVGESSKQDNLMYLKLRRWGYRRCLSINKAHNIYWHTIGNNKWAFSVKAKNGYLRLVSHIEVECSSTKYVKVKSDRSPYDGDAVYWSSRMGRHPEIANRVAILLKKQKGKCAHCGLYFRDGDIFEIDHIIPKSKGGKDNYQNLQLLHGHCHDSKTANDGSLKPKHGVCNE